MRLSLIWKWTVQNVRSKSSLGINIYHSLGLFSWRQIGDIVFYFFRIQDLTFHANGLHWRQFAWMPILCFFVFFFFFCVCVAGLRGGGGRQLFLPCRPLMADNSCPADQSDRHIRTYTVCHSVLILDWNLFASVDKSKFKNGIVHFRNSEIKGLKGERNPNIEYEQRA